MFNPLKLVAMKRIGSIAIVLSLFTACNPFSKEEYLTDYKQFVDEVSTNAKNYSESEWQRANEKYARFNNEYYNKFKDDFTLQEKMRIASYKIQYNAVKAGHEAGKFYESYLKKDVDELRKELKYYVDNKMDDDVKRVLDEAKKVSDEFYQELKKIIAEFKEEHKD